MSIQLLNLRDVPHFIPDVADRLWHAWWQYDGEPMSAVVAALDEVVAAPAFPFTLVALVDGAFAGTVTAIASDLAERPELGPWIAALWVEPDHRGLGIARTLVETATSTMFAQGNERVYLYANPPMQPYYLGIGWTLIEERFGKMGIDIFIRDARPAGA